MGGPPSYESRTSLSSPSFWLFSKQAEMGGRWIIPPPQNLAAVTSSPICYSIWGWIKGPERRWLGHWRHGNSLAAFPQQTANHIFDWCVIQTQPVCTEMAFIWHYYVCFAWINNWSIWAVWEITHFYTSLDRFCWNRATGSLHLLSQILASPTHWAHKQAAICSGSRGESILDTQQPAFICSCL